MDYHNLALFSDLDGTLLDSQRQVSRENRQALEHFIAGGGLFGISTCLLYTSPSPRDTR